MNNTTELNELIYEDKMTYKENKTTSETTKQDKMLRNPTK